jgi:Nif-specific regulatory protein
VLTRLRTAGDTDPGLSDGLDPRSEPASLADIERQHILETLNQTGWNKSRAAIILGIERSTLDRKIRRYELVEQRAHND